MQSTVLILGARGRFGLATARAFADAGWRVLAQMRADASVPAQAAGDARVKWLAMDLHDTAALVKAAQGASVVVHAINPPYTHAAWKAQAQQLLDASIAVTHALGATLMFPGNVYNFGDAMPSVLKETTPQVARTVKGQIRVSMEARLERSGVRSIVIRAGDFFGSGKGTWFDQAIVKDIRKGVFAYPGKRDVATAWAYLPDLARTFVLVAAQRDKLPPFEVLHFAGSSITGQQWLDALNPVAQAQGWVTSGASLKFTGMPWPLIRLGALFVPAWAALVEMRYLWDIPHVLANEKLVALIGPEPHTPLAKAADAALADLGLLKKSTSTIATAIANA